MNSTRERCVGRGTLFTDRRCLFEPKATLFLSDELRNALSHRSDPPGVDGAARAARGRRCGRSTPRARLSGRPASAGGLTFTMTVPTKSLERRWRWSSAWWRRRVRRDAEPCRRSRAQAQHLRPGDRGGELTKYFIWGGFASVQTVAPPSPPPAAARARDEICGCLARGCCVVVPPLVRRRRSLASLPTTPHPHHPPVFLGGGTETSCDHWPSHVPTPCSCPLPLSDGRVETT